MGISGRIAQAFLHSPITPLLALIGLILGVFAVLVTPKEEEPQIDVTFADVYIPFPGASPREIENLVTLPAEQIISELNGIDTLYSFTMPDGVMLVVVFEVGKTRNDAIVNLYNQIYSNLDRLPSGAGVGQPIIKPRAIDDVPIVSLTLFSDQDGISHQDLSQVAHGLETELKKIPGTRDIYTVGQHELVASVRVDPAKMNSFGISLAQLSNQLQGQNQRSAQSILVQDNQEIVVQAGQFVRSIDELRELVVGVYNEAPVFLGDVAEVKLGADIPTQSAWHGENGQLYPAVTIAIAKQAGENAVAIAEKIEQRIKDVENTLIPQQVKSKITRNYGKTAAEKSNTLIGKLAFATAAVVILVALTMGLREAIVVGIAIGITLAITLFASWAWGFTLNRVSLFALIFSIGILVDDAIVVVENIHRHMAMGKRKLAELIPLAVDEVGGPTILATFTVIAALLPMAFVSGLMGPYMSPIPINASLGMLISLLVAFVLTPWLSQKLLRHEHDSSAHAEQDPELKSTSRLQRFFNAVIGPFLHQKQGRRARLGLWAGVMILIAGAMSLPALQLVVMKMLPFDNKSEMQVIVDMPEGTPFEISQRLVMDLSHEVAKVEEVSDYQLYIGTTAPINFNGLVRHYFLRNTANSSDIQVNLVDKSLRERSSHEIALDLRPKLQLIGERYSANVKVVEVPPGPPVWSPIVAEVYGPSQTIREQAAQQLEQYFHQQADIVDIDIYLPSQQDNWQLDIDRSRVSKLGLNYSEIVNTIATAVGGTDIGYLHKEQQKHAVPIRLEVSEASKVDLQQILDLQIYSFSGATVPLSQVVSVRVQDVDKPIIHKNMVPMVMVVADMAGPLDSPLYGMFDMALSMQDDGLNFTQNYVEQPDGLSEISVLWDGEWKITYETFRDMGIAYGVGMIMIYLLVVAQFRSYLVPLVIMAPIPLTVIGVLPGHALFGAQFTATSMIGMIALAGIIVRNSILLVDFINQETQNGVPFEQAVINSGAVRAKPIILTGLAAMIGALFILDDPIFNGLAISLIFGILVSTILTLVVIPVLYYSVMYKRYD
ncbi:efflux RND transporter permease subunit [Alginatibacterium sediminis]|uniref:Efflux RND transporter permease subunit n=1 Tax=Alginatibacterium sediminis TaxID=2164068 RepID=A0A420E7U0_9ALTE|nr:efflux RND transporter permease subunit [Alginatibacterium sediminis]RKF14475.1 efflux RND transporter permease subunit [Alginatibacterium sediminis]